MSSVSLWYQVIHQKESYHKELLKQEEQYCGKVKQMFNDNQKQDSESFVPYTEVKNADGSITSNSKAWLDDTIVIGME